MRSTYRYLYLFLLFSQSFIICVAQKPAWIRNAEIGSSGRTVGKRVAVHPDGSVFVLGQYNGDIIISGQSLNDFPKTIDDGFLAKYNANGDLIWIKQLFQSFDDYSNRVLDLKIDHQGDLVFSGSCLWPSSILGSATGTGIFIAKIDVDGNLLWLDFPPLTGGIIAEHDGRGNRIGFDSDNNILWVTDQINEFGPSGALVVEKYAPDGSKLRSMPITRNSTFYTPHIDNFSVDIEGNFIISGNFPFTVAFKGGPSIGNSGSNFNPMQFFVAKFDADGGFQWVVRSNYQSNVVTSHTIDHDGNVYLGMQIDSGAILYTPHGSVNITSNQRSIAKLNKNGKLEWINPLSLTNIKDIFLAPDGLLYLTGLCFGDEFRYQSYIRPKSSTSTAAFILKVNTEGNFYGIYMGEPEDDPSTDTGPSVEGHQSVVDINGNIYTIGGFWDRQIWGCVPAITKNYSFFLTKHSPAPSPIKTIKGPALSCDGTEIKLSTHLVSNDVLYKWFIPGITDPGPGTVMNNSITILANHEYNGQPVIVSITDDCDEYFAEPFILNIQSSPNKPQLNGSSEIICPGSSYEFTIAEVEDDVTYQWIMTDGITAPDLPDVGGEFLFAADFVEGDIKITATNDCGSTDTTLHIATFPTPEAPVLTGNQIICPEVTDILISAQPVVDAVSYQWELPPFITFDPSYDQNLTILHAVAQKEFVSGEIKVRAVGECKNSDFSLPVEIRRESNPGNAGQ